MIGVYLSLAVAGAGLAAQSLTSEFPVEERAMVAATAEFFDAIEDPDKTRDETSYTDAIASANLPAGWRDAALSQLLAESPVEGLTAYRITWYPVDTLLGAVDFVGRDADNRQLVCGYLLWEFPQADAPRLRWHEMTRVDTAELASMSQEEAGATLLEANCAFTDVEANFALSKR